MFLEPVRVRHQDVDEPGRGLLKIRWNKFHLGHPGKLAPVEGKHLLLPRHPPRQLLHLLQADDRLQIGIFEIVANDFMEIDAGFATSKILDLLDAIKQLRVIRQQGPALAGGDDLRSAERKAPHRAESAQMPALPSRAQRLRGIFNHKQAVTPGQGHCCIHVRRAAIQAHKHNRAGRRGDCIFG